LAPRLSDCNSTPQHYEENREVELVLDSCRESIRDLEFDLKTGNIDNQSREAIQLLTGMVM
jgi:hypothetical protein